MGDRPSDKEVLLATISDGRPGTAEEVAAVMLFPGIGRGFLRDRRGLGGRGGMTAI